MAARVGSAEHFRMCYYKHVITIIWTIRLAIQYYVVTIRPV